MTTRAAYVKIDHAASSADPDDGWCTHPQCGRRLEVPSLSNGYGSRPRHARGGAGKLRTEEAAKGRVVVQRQRTEVDDVLIELREAVKMLKTRTHSQAIELGTLKNQQKQLINRLEILENSTKQAQISHKRIKDGGEHAKTQRKRYNGAQTQPIALLKASWSSIRPKDDEEAS